MSAPPATHNGRTPVWLDLGCVSYASAIATLIVGHTPIVQLVGVSVANKNVAGVKAANWLKVSGLLTVPVYAPKEPEGQTDDASLLIGSRFPPLAAGTIHVDPLENALRDVTEKYGVTPQWIHIGKDTPVAQPNNELVRPALAASSTSAVTLDGLRNAATEFNSPWGSLVLDLLNAPEFDVQELNASLEKICVNGSIISAMAAANEKSHLNKIRKSKAPSQKVAKPGQVAASSSSAAASSSSAGASEEHVYPAPGPLPVATPLLSLPADSPLRGLQEKVTDHVSAMLVDSLMYDASKGEHLFILYDQHNELTRLLARGYRGFIEKQGLTQEQSTFLNFDDDTPESILCRLWALKPHDSVILIQSQQFRLNDYRIRLELFKRSIRSIEHVHLEIIAPEEYPPYVDALEFSPRTYGALAYTLKEIVDRAEKVVVECKDGAKCEYLSSNPDSKEPCMQDCKLNIGDYRHMKQVGGTYPIGEVFSEARSLSGVNGYLNIFGYPSLQKKLVMVEKPIKLHIVQGVLQFDPTASPSIVPENSTPEFVELLSKIKEGEGEIVIREFGMGLNKGMGPEKGRTVADIFAFERQHGLHVSLGKKHNVFKADGIKGKQTTFHIDVFVDVKSIECDGKKIFQGNEWTVDITKNWKGEPLAQQQQEEQKQE